MALCVLIIEDELEFAEFIISGLTEEGFSVEHAVDGNQGWEMLGRRSWDLVLLDWSLPCNDGLSLLRGYRQSGGEAPIIFLTARDEVDDRVMGLDSGADDYLCKPFAFAELLARVRALLRRRERPSSLILSQGDVSIDLVAQRANVPGGRSISRPRNWPCYRFFFAIPARFSRESRSTKTCGMKTSTQIPTPSRSISRSFGVNSSPWGLG